MLAQRYILVLSECLQCHLVFSDICATSKITDLDEHETQIPTGTFACIIYSVFLLAEAAFWDPLLLGNRLGAHMSYVFCIQPQM